MTNCTDLWWKSSSWSISSVRRIGLRDSVFAWTGPIGVHCILLVGSDSVVQNLHNQIRPGVNGTWNGTLPTFYFPQLEGWSFKTPDPMVGNPIFVLSKHYSHMIGLFFFPLLIYNQPQRQNRRDLFLVRKRLSCFPFLTHISVAFRTVYMSTCYCFNFCQLCW